ncbi:hypothetical protein AGMMS49975_25580 [Clostridia bacterium]|nr:hypothetical protein AGMMS49975_25580 [Clostridia bacterium]
MTKIGTDISEHRKTAIVKYLVYMLMSMNTVLAEVLLNSGGGIEYVEHILKSNAHLLPAGANDERSVIDWFNSRRIPAKRKS